MATLCMVIEVRHNPINKQTQLQLVTQCSSPEARPHPGPPQRAPGLCTQVSSFSCTKGAPAQMRNLSPVVQTIRGIFILLIINPSLTSKHYPLLLKVSRILSGSTEVSF